MDGLSCNWLSKLGFCQSYLMVHRSGEQRLIWKIFRLFARGLYNAYWLILFCYMCYGQKSGNMQSGHLFYLVIKVLMSIFETSEVCMSQR